MAKADTYGSYKPDCADPFPLCTEVANPQEAFGNYYIGHDEPAVDAKGTSRAISEATSVGALPMKTSSGSKPSCAKNPLSAATHSGAMTGLMVAKPICRRRSAAAKTPEGSDKTKARARDLQKNFISRSCLSHIASRLPDTFCPDASRSLNGIENPEFILSPVPSALL